MSYRLDKIFANKCSEIAEPPSHIKENLMIVVSAESFCRPHKAYLRYGIAFASFLLISGGGTVFASQLAVPGNALYGIKRASENAYVNMQFNDQARAAVQEKLIGRRIDEAEHLADSDGDIDEADDLENQLLNEAASASDAWINAQENSFDLVVAGAS